MQLSTILEKKVEISEVSVKDAKARRIFILADGKRTLASILKMCMIAEDEGLALVEILHERGVLGVQGDLNERDQQKIPATPVTASPENGQANDQQIKVLTSLLAQYVGPAAAIVMEDAVDPERSNLSEIIERAAANIGNVSDREKFITTAKTSV